MVTASMVREQSIYIKRRDAFLFILLFLAIKIDSIYYILPGQQLYYYGSLGVLFLSGMMFVASKTKKSPVICLTIALFALLFFSTIVHTPGNLTLVIKAFSAPLAIALLTEINMCKRPINYLEVVNTLFLLLMLIDLCTMVIFPKGLYATNTYTDNWFLGYKSARVRAVTLPSIAVAGILDNLRNGKLKMNFFAASFLAILVTFLSGATAGVVVCILEFIAISILDLSKNTKMEKVFRKVFDAKIVLIVFISLNLFFVVFQAFVNSGFIEYIVTVLMDKSMTFTNRTSIWTVSLEQFKKAMIIGNGYIDGNTYTILTGIRGGTQPHNLMLAILVYAGVIGFVIYLTMLYIALRKIGNKQGIIHIICAISIFLNLIFGITSMNLFGQFHYAMMVMIYYLMKNNKTCLCGE